MSLSPIIFGSTGNSVDIFVQDSSSTTGAGLAGLAYNTASLTCYYSFTGAFAGSVSVTLVTLATITTAWASGGFKEIDATNMKGWYRFDVPNLAGAGGSGPEVNFHFQGAANMAPCPVKIGLAFAPLTAAQIATGIWQDATGGDFTTASSIGKSLYTSGAAPGAAGGLFVAGTNAATVITTSLSTHFVGTLDTLTTYTGNTPQTGDAYARLGTPSGASIDADILTRLATSGYTAPPTVAAIATGLWTDTTAGDFATASSPGKILVTQLGGAFTTASSSIYSTASLANAPTGGSAPTASQVARAVWQDLLSSGDFSTAGSIGLLLETDINAQLSTLSTYAGGDTSGTTTLLARLTSTRAGNLDFLDVAVSTRSTYAGGAVASVTGDVTVGTNLDKTGYSLASTGLDSIAITPTTGLATTFPAMVVQLWRRFFKGGAKTVSTLSIQTFADDGTTVLTTQPYTDDGAGNETLGAGS